MQQLNYHAVRFVVKFPCPKAFSVQMRDHECDWLSPA